MTERSHGAPSGDPVLTEWADALRADLTAVRRTDALVETLAARRAAGSADPAVRLLNALLADVDEPVLRSVSAGHTTAGHVPAATVAGEETPRPVLRPVRDGSAGEQVQAAGAEPRRRGPRTIVALGVAGVVLASTGVAAAGNGAPDPAPRPGAAEVRPEARAEQPEPGKLRGEPQPPQQRQRPAAPPVPAGPADERPDRSVRPRASDPVREGLEDLKDRVEGMLPPDRPHKKGRPAWQPKQHKGARNPIDETRRRLDEIRRQAERRAAKYKHPW